MNKKTIGITGSNGFIGHHLTRYLSEKGYRIIQFIRKKNTHHSGRSDDIRFFELGKNLIDKEFQDVDILVHLAFEYNRPNAVDEDANLFTANQLIKLNIPVVFISSFSAIPPFIDTYYGKTKSKMEAILSNHCILRPGLVIGNGGLFHKIVLQIRRLPLLPIIDGGIQPIQLIHIDDLCHSILRCIEEFSPSIYHIAHPEVITYAQFVREVSKNLKVKCRFISLPPSLIITIVKLFSKQKFIRVNTDNIKGLLNAKSINNTKDYEYFNCTWLSPKNSIKLIANPFIP